MWKPNMVTVYRVCVVVKLTSYLVYGLGPRSSSACGQNGKELVISWGFMSRQLHMATSERATHSQLLHATSKHKSPKHKYRCTVHYYSQRDRKEIQHNNRQ